jgi:hypothetical protein
MSTAVFVTTYNRPQALARSLPQIVGLGAPVLVVDDGSNPADLDQNESLAEDHGAAFLFLPENRGLAAAMNIGLSYWLADPAVEWISYFQDDVDVRKDALQVLAKVQDRGTRPLLTGHDAAEHKAVRSEVVNGVSVTGKGNCRATHLHAHRDYWAGVMPLQSRGLHTPCRPDMMPPEWRERYAKTPESRGCGSEVDHWITHRAPQSVVAKGGYVVCVPGLVLTFLWKAEDSCWNNRAPLGPDIDA